MTRNDLGGGYSPKANREPALIAGSRVLLDNAPFGGAVDDRKRLRHLGLRTSGILLLDQLAQGANLVPQARLPGTINHGPALLDAHTLQGGYSISHS